MTKIELKFIPNSEIYIFFEKGIIGQISYISKYMQQSQQKIFKTLWSETKIKKYYILGTNNLYDYAMSKFLRTSRLKWIELK